MDEGSSATSTYPEKLVTNQHPAVEEAKPWTGLTKEKQRELQLLANSARMQVQKSMRDLTREIRQLRQVLDTSQRHGADLEGIVVQDSIIPTQSPRSGLPGCHRERLVPEAWQGNSAPNVEEPKEISALLTSVAQSGQIKTACTVVGHSVNCSFAKEPSMLCDNIGRPTIVSKQRSKATLVSNGQSKGIEVTHRHIMKESATLARKYDACRLQVLEPETLCETGTWYSSDHRRSHSCTEAQPLRKRWVVSEELVDCSSREPSSPTTAWVSSSNNMPPREQNHRLNSGNYVPHGPSRSRQQNGPLDVKRSYGPRAYVSRKQNQGLNENTIPRAKLLETYLKERGRKEIQEKNQHGRPKALGRILRKDTEHPRMEKLSRDLHRRMEKKFAEAVENYFVKLMTYEEKVLHRWFTPTGELQSLESEQFPPAKVQDIKQEWFSPDQLDHLKEQKHAHASKVSNFKVEREEFSTPVSFKCIKQGQLSATEKVECLREQQKCNEDGSHHKKIPVRRSRGDKKLDVLTINKADTLEPRHSKVEAVEQLLEDNLSAHHQSETHLVSVDQKCHKKSKLAIIIADRLLDEALGKLAEELRTWCGKVVDHLIDGELGTNTLKSM